MILIGLGANLPSVDFDTPLQTCLSAVDAISQIDGVQLGAQSNWYKSAPVPVSDQPWYVNGVIQVETTLSALNLLAQLHIIEADYGRIRGERNAARVLDLDLLAYENQIIEHDNVQIPHPRLHMRAFVLLPIRDICPTWKHPKTAETLGEMIKNLPEDQVCTEVT